MFPKHVHPIINIVPAFLDFQCHLLGINSKKVEMNDKKMNATDDDRILFKSWFTRWTSSHY